MGKRGLGLVATFAVVVSTGLDCAHADRRTAPAPRPDEMADVCAKLDAPGAVLASHQRLAPLPDDGGLERQRAEFDLALGYYCLGLYSESLATLDPTGPRVATVQQLDRAIDRSLAPEGAEARPVYPPFLRLLLLLHRRFPGWWDAEQAVVRYAPTAEVTPALADVRDELRYLAGRSAYASGAFLRALELFAKVGGTSPFYVRAQLLAGAAYVRRYEAKPAVAAFQEALRAATRLGGPDADRLREVANISLARTFYSTGNFDLAAKYYGRIPGNSISWRDRLFETSWNDYRRGDYEGTVEGVSALRATGGVTPEVMADATMLEAAAALAMGERFRAAAASETFHATYPQLLQELKAFVTVNANNDALYARAAALRGGNSDVSPAAAAALRAALADPALVRRFNEVDEMTREIAVYARLPTDFRSTAAAQAAYADLKDRRAAAVEEAGALCRGRIRRVIETLAFETSPYRGVLATPLNASLKR